MYKPAIAFVAGAVIGAGAAWYICSSYYAQQAEEEIQSVREWAREEVRKASGKASKQEKKTYFDLADQYEMSTDVEGDPRPWIPTREEIGEPRYSADSKPSLRSLATHTYSNDDAPSEEAEKAAMSRFSASEGHSERSSGSEEDDSPSDEAEYNPDEEEEDPDEDFPVLNPDYEETDLDPDRDPFVIPELDFCMNDIPEWGKEQLTYYAGDDTLCDDQDKPVPMSIIGGENLVHFDPKFNVMFIRNNKLHCDYEVERVLFSYTSYVLGIEEDTPRKTRYERNEEE